MKKKLPIQALWSLRSVLSALLILAIFYINYFLERTEFAILISFFGVSFALYLALIYSRFNQLKDHFRWVISLGILIRLIILFAVPNLSDDYFRFLWDGNLIHHGISPYAATPAQLMTSGIIHNDYTTLLFNHLNSPNYYSVYPPINQYIFALANLIAPYSILGGVLFLKLMILLFEVISILTLKLIADRYQLNKNAPLLYAINPLIIIEFSGNLHFEGIMIAFLLLSIYWLGQNKRIPAALTFSGAILTKLHPIMLLPFLIKYLGWKKGVIFLFITLAICVLLFFPFIIPPNQTIVNLKNILTSLRLYFENFEFNAGIYYLLRWVGSIYYGYNPIQIVGRVLLIVNIFGLIILFFRQKSGLKSLLMTIMLAYLTYNLLATTVHPWYIISMLPFAFLLGVKTPLMWSGIIIVSYFSYSTSVWHENFYLLSFQYALLFVFLFYEYKRTLTLHESSN